MNQEWTGVVVPLRVGASSLLSLSLSSFFSCRRQGEVKIWWGVGIGVGIGAGIKGMTKTRKPGSATHTESAFSRGDDGVFRIEAGGGTVSTVVPGVLGFLRCLCEVPGRAWGKEQDEGA